MITDGKPTCIKQGIKYYKNAFGLDQNFKSNVKPGRTIKKAEVPNIYDCF
jgi:hypothetical protein